MTMDPFAPLGRIINDPQRTCNHSPDDSPNTDCGGDATWHIMWNAEAEVSFACDPHMDVARRRFVFVGAHQLGPDCGMPSALWDLDENRCVYPDEPAANEARGVVAAPSAGQCTHSFPDPHPHPMDQIGDCRHCEVSYTEARQGYDGPSVREAAATDRAYWEQRDAGEGA